MRSSALSDLDGEHAERHRRNLYGRRKGPKLSAHQLQLRKTLLPLLSLQLQNKRDPRDYFGKPVDDVWLEVGYGGGEHLLWQAKENPRVGIIGAEPYVSGTAKLLSKIELLTPTRSRRTSFGAHDLPLLGGGEKLPPPLSSPSKGEVDPVSSGSEESGSGGGHLPNIRLYEDDARDIIEALPDASIGRFFILFPDPWHKTRHHKRRFIQTEMLAQIARILKPGAEFRFASDDAGYVAYTLERLMAHPAFVWTAMGPTDWRTRPADWPPTRYETKELHGPPAFLRFVRTGRTAA